jgi:hypothetical protein
MKANRIGRNALMILGLAVTSTPAFSRTPVDNPHLAVRLYDYVNVPAGEWNDIRTNAERVLRQAGVDVEFFECYRDRTESSIPACQGYLRPGELMLRIVPAKTEESRRKPAYAAMTPEGGAMLTICINPDATAADSGVLSYGALLGHTVAHEIGHLLLGPGSHSPGGLMRAVWRQTEMEMMAKRSLLFDARQSEKIRSALLALREK